MKSKVEIIKDIRKIDVSDKTVTFASDRGPCKYCHGESYEIRSAKHDKILESINRESK